MELNINHMLVLALDVGTSSARARCFDEQARALPGAEGRVTYEPITSRDGGVELDPEALVRAVAEAVDACLRGAESRAPEIRAVSASVFWHSLLALDPAGRPLTPVITWADTRSADAAAELSRLLDAHAIHARTGAPLHSTFFPAKLRWLRESRAELFARAATWCGFAEYLALRLTGSLAASLSMASGTGLLDQETCSWDRELLAVCAIEAGQLPPIDDAPAPGLTREFAARWPVLARVPWLPAHGDGVCSNLGSGCRGPERVAINVGTSAAVRVVTPLSLAPPAGLWRYRVDRARNLVGGATSEGGNVLAWCRRVLALPGDDAALERALDALPPDGHGLTVLPFLAGERSPGWRGDARATVSGAWLDTGAVEILRAMMESVAYRLGMIYERLRPVAGSPHEVVASGGALVHSATWPGILADVLGGPITLSEEAEASSRGAALLALEALGAPPPRGAPGGRRIHPDERRHAIYRAAMERQQRLYDNVVAPRLS
jgi:gluconokinase